MKKCIIFGASGTGRKIYEKLIGKKDYQIIGFSDNDSAKQGTLLYSLPVIAPTKIKELDYDIVFIAALTGESTIKNQLISLGVLEQKINSNFVQYSKLARLDALNGAAKLIYDRNISGSVAELGVFQGEFASEINKLFPDRKFYFFDTFEGFNEQDVASEGSQSAVRAGELNETSVDLVLNKLTNKDMCIIKKGYFPQTAEGLEDTFAFVNLDPDLYSPILAGLRYFYPRMSEGGIIFVHDYFNPVFPGASKAVWDFQREYNIKVVPIGDDSSVAVVK